MKKKYFTLCIVISVTMIFTRCGFLSGDDKFTSLFFEWKFLNANDSIPISVNKTFNYKVIAYDFPFADTGRTLQLDTNGYMRYNLYSEEYPYELKKNIRVFVNKKKDTVQVSRFAAKKRLQK